MKNKDKKLLLIFGVIIMIMLSLSFVKFGLAQTTAEEGLSAVGDQIGLTAEDPRVVAARIIRVFLGFLGIVAICVVLYGGFLYMTSGGNETAVAKAKSVLINGLIGLVIIVASFAITSYVISTLSQVTGITGGGTGDGGDGGGDGLPGGGSITAFNVAISPKGENRPISSVVKVGLLNNKELIPDNDYQNAKDSVKIYAITTNEEGQETETEVAGSYDIINNSLKFIPDQTCPAECLSEHCFDASTNYRVKIFELKSSDNLTVACPNKLSGFCQKIDFSTSLICDNDAPQVSLAVPFLPIELGADAVISGSASDVSGVVSMTLCPDYVKNETLCETVYPSGEIIPENFDYTFNVNTADFDLGTHQAYLNASDGSDLEKNISKNYFVASGNCFTENGDFDCAQENCEIENCDGSDHCHQNETGQIVCLGWPYPIITDFSPKTGPVGTYVTITGKKFGEYDATKSKVEINGLKFDYPCVGNSGWSDTQVVVKVPDNAITGGLKLTNEDGDFADTINPDSPSIKENFTVTQGEPSNIGLCSVLNKKNGTAIGTIDELVNASGENFLADGQVKTDQDKVYFNGNEASYTGAWSKTSIQDIRIPSVKSGVVSVQVGKNGVYSNAVRFNVIETPSEIAITAVNPNPAPPSQYITITGKDFGVSGVVNFKSDDKTYPATVACTSGWQDNQIVVVVPKDIPNGDYDLEVSANNASAKTDFTIDNQLTVMPGLCAITPNNGPAGTVVKAIGAGFGATGGEVDFIEDKITSGFDWSDKEITNIQVPPLAKSGSVYIKTNQNQESNKLNFTVGKCQAGKCPSGQVCCQNQYCTETANCEALKPTTCSYSWYFSTGVLPKVPKIIEKSCISGISDESPSPAKNSEIACPNGKVSFTFNLAMNPLSFSNKIELKKWPIINNVCDIKDCQGEDCQTISYNRGIIDEENDFFSANYPLASDIVTQVILSHYRLSPLFCYQVTVKSGVESLANAEDILPSDYSWKFKTASTDCAITGVVVKPTDGLIKEIDAEQKYQISGQANNCGIIDVSKYDWSWSVIKYQDRIKKIIKSDLLSNIAYFGVNTTAAVLETPIDDPGQVRVAGIIDNKNLSADANLVIKFTEPKIIDYFPNCKEVCRNALLGVTFNTYVKYSTLVDAGNVKVYKCQSQDCQSNLSSISLTAANLPALDCKNYNGIRYCKSLQIVPPQTLDNSSYYRVVVSRRIESVSRYNLTDLNYSDLKDLDEAGVEILDSFSWLFKTRDSEEFCRLESVAVLPAKYQTNKINEQVEYFAAGFGAPDTCSAAGQKLNSYKYNWIWTSDKYTGNAQVDLIELLTEKFNIDKPAGCSDGCLNLGSNLYGAKCGNAKIEVGEECDDGNGVNDDGCSEKCLLEGTSATCGNNQVENKEECDDGNTKDNDGCSAKCLNEGSSKSGFICGNNKKEFGEDADFGNLSLNQKFGLDNNCLRVGSVYKASENISICGNGSIEPGEECEAVTGDCVNPAGQNCNVDTDQNCVCNFVASQVCSNKCLNLGTIACTDQASVNCCGNGALEAGEDCDDGNSINGDGCSAKCLNEGSNIKYNSICNNGVKEIGEDLSCESGVGSFGSPLMYAKILGNLPDTQTNDTAIITAKVVSNVALNEASTIVGKAVSSADSGNNGNLVYVWDGTANPPADCTELPELITPNNQVLCINASPEFVFDKKAIAVDGEISANEVLLTKQCPTGYCPVPNYKVTSHSATGNQTVINIIVTDDKNSPKPLDPAANYKVSLQDLKDSCGQGIGTNEIYFSTSNNYCHFDTVAVDPAYYQFTRVNEEKLIYHIAKSGNFTLTPIPGQYDWSWQPWQVEDSGLVNLLTLPDRAQAKNKNGTTEITATAEITTDTVFLENSQDEAGNPIHRMVNGVGTLEVFICENPQEFEISAQNMKLSYCRDRGLMNDKTDDFPLIRLIGTPQDTGNCADGIDNDGDGYADHVTTYYYENYTGSVSQDQPFSISQGDYNLSQSLHYEQGMNLFRYLYNFVDKPQQIKYVPAGETVNIIYSFAAYPTVYIQATFTFDAGKIYYDMEVKFDNSDPKCDSIYAYEQGAPPATASDVLREAFFLRNNDVNDATRDLSPDAIALRIYKNPENISAREWYDKYVPNSTGGLADMKVNCTADTFGKENCFHGVKDGSTVYVSGGNLSGANLYNNIYVLGYSVDANSNTTNIYSQMVNNLKLITNVTGSDINNRIKRDIKRVNDINYLKKLLNNYHQLTGGYPALESGTYQRGFVLSAWPSWQSILGNLLGQALPIDPINKFAEYKPSTTKSCINDDCLCPGTALKCLTNDQCFNNGENWSCSICAKGSDVATCYNSTENFISLGDSVPQSAELEFYSSASYLFGYEYLTNSSARLHYKFEGVKNSNYHINGESGGGNTSSLLTP